MSKAKETYSVNVFSTNNNNNNNNNSNNNDDDKGHLF